MTYLTIIGLVAGILGGMFGIGGGIIIVPALVYLSGFSQHMAQGTSLAVLVLPIGILGALKYYYSGNVDLKSIPFICIGFLIGALIGASFVQPISDLTLKRFFGIFLLFVSIKMIIGK